MSHSFSPAGSRSYPFIYLTYLYAGIYTLYSRVVKKGFSLLFRVERKLSRRLPSHCFALLSNIISPSRVSFVLPKLFRKKGESECWPNINMEYLFTSRVAFLWNPFDAIGTKYRSTCLFQRISYFYRSVRWIDLDFSWHYDYTIPMTIDGSN